MDDVTKKYSSMFVVAALFNWIVGFSFLKPRSAYEMMGVTQIPNEDMTLHVVCLIIILIGVEYYKASKDFPAQANVVRFGMYCKAGVVVLSIVDIALGYVDYKILQAASGELLFASLFYKALQDLDAAKKSK